MSQTILADISQTVLALTNRALSEEGVVLCSAPWLITHTLTNVQSAGGHRPQAANWGPEGRLCPNRVLFVLGSMCFNLHLTFGTFHIKIHTSRQAAAHSFDGDTFFSLPPSLPCPPRRGHASGGTDPHLLCFSSSLSRSLIYNRVCKL